MNYKFGKRIFDVSIAIFVLAVFSPIFLLLFILVRFFLGSPVIFKQMRPGLHEKPFYLYKFRTMVNRYDAQGKLLDDEFRMTKFGKFLRSTSLDELPALLNVVRGDMSLVGPRPLLMEYLPHYSLVQRKRHDVRPGITGWAQVNGRNTVSWDEKFKLDGWYVAHQSFALDMKILFLTVSKVLRREGINAAGQATMTRFDLESKSGAKH